MALKIIRPRQLGAQGLQVPALGAGCMGLTGVYGDDTASADPESLIRRAIDLGMPFFDTSDAYGPFINEEVVGSALKGRRNDVVLATKFGVVRSAGQSDGLSATGIDGRPEYVKRACEASLKRLQTDYIDLYYMHRPDPGTPIEDTVGAMAELVRAGKVRYIGLCEVGPSLIRRAHVVHPLSAVQSEYSLWHRDPEDAVLPLLCELGIGFVCYSPLGRGFLTGKIRSLDDLAPDDWRRLSPRFQGENFKKNLDVVDRVNAIATGKGCTTAQLALAWLSAQGEMIVPLQGATSISQLEENIGALEVRLTREDLESIERVAPKGIAAGEAWPEGSVGAQVDPETRARR
jgi:aryl-alcohol dehydrogenase-like predicted oxidoreductase